MGEGQAKESNTQRPSQISGWGLEISEWSCNGAVQVLVLRARETIYCVCSRHKLLLCPYFCLFSRKAMGYLLAFLPTSGEEDQT